MVKTRVRNILLLIIIISFIIGCGSKISRTIIPDYDKKGIRLVALMPITNKTGDAEAAILLRKTMLEKIYFKGYPKIPLNVVDEKIKKIYGNSKIPEATNISSKAVGEILGVDAVMYCTLDEWKTSLMLIYAPTTVAVSFELRSAKTAEILWKTNYKVVKRNYDFTNKRLEMKSCQTFELAAQEVVDKAMSTLPNGPDFPGGAPVRKRHFLGLW
jgi:hypothetical protein